MLIAYAATGAGGNLVGGMPAKSGANSSGGTRNGDHFKLSWHRLVPTPRPGQRIPGRPGSVLVGYGAVPEQRPAGRSRGTPADHARLDGASGQFRSNGGRRALRDIRVKLLHWSFRSLPLVGSFGICLSCWESTTVRTLEDHVSMAPEYRSLPARVAVARCERTVAFLMDEDPEWIAPEESARPSKSSRVPYSAAGLSPRVPFN
jgi:hypothetical protein